jgi:1-acyl-sn-glycerol-3-phosphate acyltransferase
LTSLESVPANASDRPSAPKAELTAPQRGPLFRLLWPLTTYVVTNLVVAGLLVLFRVFNRTTVIGREHVGYARNTLLLSNHQSMIDSFLVGVMAFFPRSLVQPYLIPWNPAAVENFYRTPVLAWFSDIWRCIPIREGRRDLTALRRMLKVLPRGVMTLFPEGTRMRDNKVGLGRVGAGVLMLSAKPTVIPVAIEGMQEVLPIGSRWPRFFKRIYVSYGAPIDYAEFLDGGRDKDNAQRLVDRVMGSIREQHRELRRMAGKSVPEYGPDDD